MSAECLEVSYDFERGGKEKKKERRGKKRRGKKKR
jgi:hypothetical protein